MKGGDIGSGISGIAIIVQQLILYTGQEQAQTLAHSQVRIRFRLGLGLQILGLQGQVLRELESQGQRVSGKVDFDLILTNK